MIAPGIAVVVRFAPRNAQRSDKRALEHLIFMRQQNALAQAKQAASVLAMLAEIVFEPSALPLADIFLALLGERNGQRLQELSRGALHAVSERNAEGEFHPPRQINLSRQRDVAVLSLFKFPVHFEIVHQVLPAIAVANVADGAPREIGLAAEHHADLFTLRFKELPVAQSAPLGAVVIASAFHVRREQRIETQLAAQFRFQDFQPGVYQQNRGVGLSDNFFDDAVPALAVRVGEPVKQRVLLRVFGQVVEITLLLVAKRLTVGDEKL